MGERCRASNSRQYEDVRVDGWSWERECYPLRLPCVSSPPLSAVWARHWAGCHGWNRQPRLSAATLVASESTWGARHGVGRCHLCCNRRRYRCVDRSGCRTGSAPEHAQRENSPRSYAGFSAEGADRDVPTVSIGWLLLKRTQENVVRSVGGGGPAAPSSTVPLHRVAAVDRDHRDFAAYLFRREYRPSRQ